jgi:polyisoprenoid-binding protein YceI
LVAFTAIARAGTSSAAAAEHILRVDPAASRVTIELQATLHTVEGAFAVTEGLCRLDTDSGLLDGTIVVDATSGDTGNAKRDRKMHRRVLESERYAEIVFRPESFRGVLSLPGVSEVEVHGTLDLHGAERPLVAPVAVQIEGDQARITARFAVPYVDWGLKDPSVLVLRVAKTVDVSVELEGRLEPAGPGGGPAREAPH